MAESTVTAKGQTTLPREVRAALHLHPGDKLRYIIVDGEVRLLKARSILDLEGVLKRSGAEAVSLDQMDEAIATGATDQSR